MPIYLTQIFQEMLYTIQRSELSARKQQTLAKFISNKLYNDAVWVSFKKLYDIEKMLFLCKQQSIIFTITHKTYMLITSFN